jgi:predicted transcriptional regulator
MRNRLRMRRHVFGLLRETELDGEQDGPVEGVMRPGPSTSRPHVPIDEMASFMLHRDLRSSPITTSGGRLVGLLRRQDATRAAHEQHERQAEGGSQEAGR